jgi:hypothetical protein
MVIIDHASTAGKKHCCDERGAQQKPLPHLGKNPFSVDRNSRQLAVRRILI